VAGSVDTVVAMWIFVSVADYLFDAGGWGESTQRGESRRKGIVAP
jgi:hypothetical protein